MKYVINDINYLLKKDDSNIFSYEDIKDLMTDYFNDYDYVMGDQSYGKIRLKGFCEKNNKLYKRINDISSLDDYIKDYCASGCSYFLLEKIK